MAYGTETIPHVDKILGPGNIFVVLAKQQVFGIVDIDQLPGPTETLLVADESANPALAAADMLAQAEHDPMATAILLTSSPMLAHAVLDELPRQLAELERAEIAGQSLEEVIKAVHGDASKVGVFNNAAQVWNHTFYWSCMKPGGGGSPTGDVASAIEAAFGSFDKFKDEFKNACVTQFGSGWGWLVAANGGLKISKTGNAELPMTAGDTALLTCDVWEHAYYLDYQNRRPDYVQMFLDQLVNWDFVAENLKKARG
jgi:Fe-Mn family superoxide dismutase